MANEEKKEYVQKVTPAGEASWAKVNNTVDVYEGKEQGYVICFKAATQEDEDALIKLAHDTAQEAIDGEVFKDKKTGKPVKWLAEYAVPFVADEKGNMIFKFKTSHMRFDKKSNEMVRKHVSIVDSQNKPIDVVIGNGSIVKISFSPSAYHINVRNNGVKFYLNAIQVLKLETYGGNTDGSRFGFGAEDGYEGIESPVKPDPVKDTDGDVIPDLDA